MSSYIKFLDEGAKQRFPMGYTECYDKVGEEDGIQFCRSNDFFKVLGFRRGNKVMRYICDVVPNTPLVGKFEKTMMKACCVTLSNLRTIEDVMAPEYEKLALGKNEKEVVKECAKYPPYYFDKQIARVVAITQDSSVVRSLERGQFTESVCLEIFRRWPHHINRIGDYELENLYSLMECGEIDSGFIGDVEKEMRKRRFVYW